MATAESDRLSTVGEAGFGLGWDWKGSYIDKLATEGYERFSQFSASPDTTALFAGPARYTGLSGAANLIPIGLADGIGLQSSAGIQPLYEIGSNRAFFTRGKTTHSLSMGKMLADQANILAALSKSAYRPLTASNGSSAPGATSPNPDIMMNLESEYLNVPFGLLLVFKTRGGGADGYGKALTALYLEYCMFASYAFNIASQSPVIQESVQIALDRIVPVSFQA
jgi:hypothetical protein